VGATNNNSRVHLEVAATSKARRKDLASSLPKESAEMEAIASLATICKVAKVMDSSRAVPLAAFANNNSSRRRPSVEGGSSTREVKVVATGHPANSLSRARAETGLIANLAMTLKVEMAGDNKPVIHLVAEEDLEEAKADLAVIGSDSKLFYQSFC